MLQTGEIDVGRLSAGIERLCAHLGSEEARAGNRQDEPEFVHPVVAENLDPRVFRAGVQPTIDEPGRARAWRARPASAPFEEVKVARPVF